MRPAAEKAIRWGAWPTVAAIYVVGLVLDLVPWWSCFPALVAAYLRTTTLWARDRLTRAKTRRALARLRGGRR